ncbi:CHAT domain-containing protein [Trichocoleus sp. FACHB-262]|uniref:CHAT domain-containing protein n=1 Tax=Trichocoleus sp. FACHB-262 TaxID=2692869 RepID=UPI0016882945|nr:CHAT domain-containing protein [Trichocoleus sp. FACHB-262]MBD2124549.1 CHAT domain-containing protein [Trichocoleus sp. FACHB-262]
MPQPALWRMQASSKLKSLISRMQSGLDENDKHIDDLIRTLSNLPKRPFDYYPYQEIFGATYIKEPRVEAAKKLGALLANMQDDWTENDALVDDLIRELVNLPKRPPEQIPYQEIFAETNVNWVTEDQLLAITPEADPNSIATIVIPLNLAMVEFGISTIGEQADFLAQAAYKSKNFSCLEESESGEEYENRKDLGNVEPGDGVRFKGRGLFRILGRINYKECSEALGANLIDNPQYLAEPGLACRSAAWLWNIRVSSDSILRRTITIETVQIISEYLYEEIPSLDDMELMLQTAERFINLHVARVEIYDEEASITKDKPLDSISMKGINIRTEVESIVLEGHISGYQEITRSGEASTHDESYSPIQNLTRYPNLDCPDKAIINQRFSLIVELLLEKPEDQPDLLPLGIQDTGTDELPEVEVVVSASGFDLEGSNTQILQVERDDDSGVRFVLIPNKLGHLKIKVQFYQNGKPIGKATRNILVSEQPTAVEVPQSDEPTALELKTKLTIPPQDLELFVDLDTDGRTLSFSLHSVKPEIDYHRTNLGQVTLQGSPLEKMQAIYKEMTQMAQRIPATPEDKAWAENRLAAVGNQLWDELTSDRLKQEYWKFKSRVKSILVTTEEPWIPWEMLKPYRFNDEGEKEKDPFWCQQFAISRWLSGAGMPDELDIRTTRSIAPTPINLPSVQEEVAFLEQLSSLRSTLTPLTAFGTRVQVLDSLENEDLSILHFACHGLFDSTLPNDSAIKLSDGSLRPSDIQVRFGGKRQRPLIFINACHGGRAEFSFTGLGGWAERLVSARAGVFIGAMWEVSDRLSLQFAKTFYTALLKEEKTTAESFREAREAIRQIAPYNSTWLAYTLYADPEGRIKASKA